MRRANPFVVGLWLALAVAAAAQAPKARPKPAQRPAAAKPVPAPEPARVEAWPLETLAVEGRRLYSAEAILKIAALAPGAPAGKAEFDAARDRLLNTGYFESVAYHFDPVAGKPSIRGVLEVTEVAQVFPWRIEDLPVTADDLTRLMAARDPLFGPQLPASDVFLKRLTAELRPALAARNFSAPVVARLLPEAGTGELVIVVRPQAQPPSIAEVHFRGNQAIETGDLRRAIAGIAVGAFWSEARFREYLDTTIRPMYETKGKLRTSFPKVTAAPAEGVRGVSITVEVDEGADFTLTAVRVTGAPLPPAVIEKEGDFKTGERVNFSEIGRGLERIQQVVKNNGYLKPAYKAQRRIDDGKKGVEIFVDLNPGEQYLFGKLLVKGLDIESEPAIRKLWALKAGQPFNESYPAHFLGRLRDDGVFDNLGETKHELKIDERSRFVDVVLVFAGEKRAPPRREP